EAAERKILDAVAAWWEAYDAGEYPAAAPSDELADMLDDGSFVDWSRRNELPTLLDERAALKTATSDAEKRLKEIDVFLKNLIGSASTAWLPGWNVSFKSQHRKETVI